MIRALPRLVGITGLAGCGKDTVASHLRDAHGFHVYSLAAPIKRVLNERFGWSMDYWSNREWKEKPDLFYGAPANLDLPAFSPRSWAQWLGTEVGRELFGEDCWVDLMERQIAGYRGLGASVVVPDVRFDNEAERIRELGGVVIRIERVGLQRVNDHASERGVSSHLVHARVINDSTIGVLEARAVYTLEMIYEGG